MAGGQSGDRWIRSSSFELLSWILMEGGSRDHWMDVIDAGMKDSDENVRSWANHCLGLSVESPGMRQLAKDRWEREFADNEELTWPWSSPYGVVLAVYAADRVGMNRRDLVIDSGQLYHEWYRLGCEGRLSVDEYLARSEGLVRVVLQGKELSWKNVQREMVWIEKQREHVRGATVATVRNLEE